MNPLFPNAFKLLSLPLIELFGLRLFFSRVLNLHLGLPGFTDYELFLPAPLGFFAFLWALEKNGGIFWSFSFKKLFIHLGFLISLLGFSVYLKQGISGAGTLTWWMLLSALTLSAFLLFVDVKRLLKNEALWSVVPSLLMVFSLVIYFKWGGNLFENTLSLWSTCLKTFFGFLGLKNIEVYAMGTVVQVSHPQWTIHIGRGCAGFDSLIFFGGAFCIFAPLYWRLFKKSTWALFFLLGSFFFLALNFARIIFLFCLGIFLMRFIPQKEAIYVTLNLFHLHLGYLLYALGIFTYFQILLWLAAFSSKSVPLPMLRKMQPKLQKG